MLYNTTIFEDMGFAYYGPFDGHDVENLIHVLENAKRMHQPVLLHMVTNKGKGYAFAEERPDTFHGVSKFDVMSGYSRRRFCRFGGVVFQYLRRAYL